MALSQIVKELILGLMGGEPSRADEVISGLEGGQNAVQADGSVPFTAPQAGVDPVSGPDLATKDYVDGHSGGGADTQLSNLGSTAINAPLNPDIDASYALGQPGLRFSTLCVTAIHSDTANSVIDCNNRALNFSNGSEALQFNTVLDFNSNNLTNLADLIPSDDITQNIGSSSKRWSKIHAFQLDAGASSLSLNGANIDANSKEIANLSDPSSGQAAATKHYVDTSAGYTPASSSDWNNSPPATVQAALDRIAAALGPIA